MCFESHKAEVSEYFQITVNTSFFAETTFGGPFVKAWVNFHTSLVRMTSSTDRLRT